MALLAVYFVLLLCSMSPLLSYGSHCQKGSYCPAGTDCSSNSSFCVEGVCQNTSDGPCIKEVAMEFRDSSYSVDENAGEVEIELTLDGAIECCSISVTLIVKNGTAKEDEDYYSYEYIRVKFPAGITTALIKVTVIDDYILEDDETFDVTIYELSVPYGITLGTSATTTVTIQDDDSAILTFSKPVFYVYENDGPAQPKLTLNVPAIVNFTVQIQSSNVDLSEECDEFERGIYTAEFLVGTTSVVVPINISDDDVFEDIESFNIIIIDPNADRVTVGDLNTAEVAILNDEKFIVASFDKKVYRVQEHQGSVSPEIELTEPSPCCFILHAELSDGTAHGETVDYGYAPSKIYNYTFHAGSTCASPDASIKITDDMVAKEGVESFYIRIMPYTLPFGVIPYGQATILINDNDNACWFRFDTYSASEDESVVWVEILLSSPAADDLPIQINTTDVTATGGTDYASGPHDVTITRNAKRKFFSIGILNDNKYEGDETFVITFAVVPLGLVCNGEATIEIKDDEYIVDFKHVEYYVDEGKNVQLELSLSRALQKTITVQLEYTPISPTTSSDYYTPPRFVTFRSGVTEALVTFRTRGDTTLEQKFKSVIVVAKNPLITNGTADGRTYVTIVDDDDVTIKFERSEYFVTESTPSKAKLVINRSPAKTFTVIIDQVDCDTAVRGVDYERQDYRSVATFVKSGKTFVELPIKPINNDTVECEKTYCLIIIIDLLPERVTAISPYDTKITIRDDDRTTVTRKDEVISFSIAIDEDIEIEVIYYTGPDEILTLEKGSKEVSTDSSRVTRIQRINIKVPCCFKSSQFVIRTSRMYLIIVRC